MLLTGNASVTVARPAVLNLSQWGSGGYPQPPEANVKDVYFPWPPPGNFFLHRTRFDEKREQKEASTPGCNGEMSAGGERRLEGR